MFSRGEPRIQTFEIRVCQFQCYNHYVSWLLIQLVPLVPERHSFYLISGTLNIRSGLFHRKYEHTPCIVLSSTTHWLINYYTMAVQSLCGRDNIFR